MGSTTCPKMPRSGTLDWKALKRTSATDMRVLESASWRATRWTSVFTCHGMTFSVSRDASTGWDPQPMVIWSEQKRVFISLSPMYTHIYIYILLYRRIYNHTRIYIYICYIFMYMHLLMCIHVCLKHLWTESEWYSLDRVPEWYLSWLSVVFFK